MPAPRANPALHRKIAAHARLPSVDGAVSEQVTRAATRALRRASLPFAGLGLTVTAVGFDPAQTLGDVAAAVASGGLLAALEDDAGRRGLVDVSPGLIDALIEVQTTGRVEATELPARPVTAIDEAMCRDFLDLLLGALAQEAEPVRGRDWPLRMAYGSRIADARQITLLLPDSAYHILRAEVGFDHVERRAQVTLILPSDPKLARAARQEAHRPTRNAADLADWEAARDAMVAALPLSLDAVLMRVVMSLGAVERMQPGDLIGFAHEAMAGVTLEDDAGRAVAHGRLGRADDRRALRLGPVETARGAPAGGPPRPPPTTDTHAPTPPDAFMQAMPMASFDGPAHADAEEGAPGLPAIGSGALARV